MRENWLYTKYKQLPMKCDRINMHSWAQTHFIRCVGRSKLKMEWNTLKTRRAIITQTNGIRLCAEQMLSITGIHPIHFISIRTGTTKRIWSNSFFFSYGKFLFDVTHSVLFIEGERIFRSNFWLSAMFSLMRHSSIFLYSMSSWTFEFISCILFFSHSYWNMLVP